LSFWELKLLTQEKFYQKLTSLPYSNQEYKSIKTETTKRNTDTVAIHPGNGTNKTIITPVASIGL